MKKTITIMLSFLMLISTLSGCGQAQNNNDKLSIVTTIFPEYDWVVKILGDKKDSAEVTMLLDNGVDLHSFQPTAADIVKISKCDMFIYVGGESDEWAEDAIEQADNKNIQVVNLLDILGDSVKEEEIVEGMQGEEHEDEENEEDEHEEGPEYDTHVWLSLKNSQILVSEIANSLSKIDKNNATTYSDNATKYNAKLAELDEKYQATVNNAPNKTILFGDRFPFRYLVDDYKLNYYAAFIGCSTDSEASFETIAFLAKKVDELGLKSILTLEGTKHKIAETIVSTSQNKTAKILALDSMQSVTAKDVKNGASYIAIMEKNLEVLKEALK